MIWNTLVIKFLGGVRRAVAKVGGKMQPMLQDAASWVQHRSVNQALSYSCDLYVSHKNTFFFSRCIAISFLFNQITGDPAGFPLLGWNFCS